MHFCLHKVVLHALTPMFHPFTCAYNFNFYFNKLYFSSCTDLVRKTELKTRYHYETNAFSITNSAGRPKEPSRKPKFFIKYDISPSILVEPHIIARSDFLFIGSNPFLSKRAPEAILVVMRPVV